VTEFAVERKRERRKGVIEEECLESDLESEAEELDENEDYEELNEEEEESDEDTEVPKVLGDMMESILGAVFLDSGHDLTTVWRVFRQLCPKLDGILNNPSISNPKRWVK